MAKRRFRITIGGKTFIVDVEEVGEKKASVYPIASKADVKPAREGVDVAIDEGSAEGVRTTSGEVEVKAPMPGVVLSVKCAVGKMVEEGELLLVIEAMKMENEVHSPVRGVVKKVLVSEGQRVQHGKVLVVIG